MPPSKLTSELPADAPTSGLQEDGIELHLNLIVATFFVKCPLGTTISRYKCSTSA